MTPADDAPRLGIVVPTLNEAAHLPALLSDLRHLEVAYTVVVADGGSTDDTRGLAASAGCRVIVAPPGRARQMNAGARVLDTPWLCFLHADARLDRAARAALEDHVRTGGDEAAYFRFRIGARGAFWRFIEFGQAVRERLGGLAYGDQGLIVPRARFEAAGGYPDEPLLEDVLLLRALRRQGAVRRLPAALDTSPRRYREQGRWRQWLRNTFVIGAFLAGVPPARLAHLYPPRRPPRRDGRRLFVFAKAPRPGEVK
ncbi:MAG: glycosyltransferase, partial [Gemmatimonadetes bacterium]